MTGWPLLDGDTVSVRVAPLSLRPNQPLMRESTGRCSTQPACCTPLLPLSLVVVALRPLHQPTLRVSVTISGCANTRPCCPFLQGQLRPLDSITGVWPTSNTAVN